MGLGDRVEAWARRFGVPPPADVRADDEDEPEDADEHDVRRDAAERDAERQNERFTRHDRDRR